MKKVFLSCVLLFPLMGCDQISSKAVEKIENAMPKVSDAQNIKSEKILDALRERDSESLYGLIEKSLSDDLKAHPEALEEIYEFVPQVVGNKSENISVMHTIEVGTGKYTKVNYQYDYPEHSIIFSPVFAGHDGGDKVIGLWVQQQ